MLTAIVEWGENKKSISTGYIFGKVEFTQYSPESNVKVYLRIEGLINGVHGFHIHEKPLEETEGDVMECCDKLGGHFNVGEKWSLENQSGTRPEMVYQMENAIQEICAIILWWTIIFANYLSWTQKYLFLKMTKDVLSGEV